MIKIAILDDDIQFCKSLDAILSEWANSHNISIENSIYTQGNSLLESSFNDYLIIFLDIKLPDISGIDIAKELRKHHFANHIVFLTSHEEYVFNGYHVRALDYLVKPADMQSLDFCLNYILNEKNSSAYIFESNNTMLKIPFSDIISFTADNHYVNIITTTNVYHHKTTIKNISEIAPKNFRQCHRSIIINMDYVDKIVGSDIYLSNDDVYPISQKYIKDIHNNFIEYTNR